MTGQARPERLEPMNQPLEAKRTSLRPLWIRLCVAVVGFWAVVNAAAVLWFGYSWHALASVAVLIACLGVVSERRAARYAVYVGSLVFLAAFVTSTVMIVTSPVRPTYSNALEFIGSWGPGAVVSIMCMLFCVHTFRHRVERHA
jgi:hypothetical protein